ncbi:MAG: GNAT family N-acetyltransferase [Fusobacteriales bacterium]|jgi:predicted GNAT family acetyltransferase|nr:GNAT family N-acetyltransferase [Fusobacteriales bacterium]
MIIVSYKEKNQDFWSIMGYYFANKQIRKELPYIIDENGKIWVIGFQNSKEIIGFLSYKILKETAMITNCYVNSHFRKKGYFKKLISYTLNNKLKDKTKIKLAVKHEYYDFFLKLGFCISYRKGNYIFMVKEK